MKFSGVCAGGGVGNTKNLEHFFSPKSVAVIGASGGRGSIGYTIFENFLKGGFRGKVYAVNPNHKKIQGKKSYASVKLIPGAVDLAVIAVPARFVPAVFKECAGKKVKAAIVISAGFSEIGEKKLTSELGALARKNPGTRLMGPNCIGVFVPKSGLDTSFFDERRMKRPKHGAVSFLSQSGALGAVILDWASTQRFGFGKFISYGNAMDVDEADLLEYLARDKDTKVITAYIEGAKEGRKFFDIARRTSLRKPIVALKGGITKEAHEATASHTGSLAGSAEVYNAVFEQAGIVRADGLIELFAFAKLLENEPLPKGRRVQIITNGGGFGIITTDAVVRNGLELAKMRKAGVARIRRRVPDTVIVKNPMDLTGDADEARYVLAVETALADPNVDIVVVIILFNTPTLELGIVNELGRIRKTAKKPIVVVSVGSGFTQRNLEKMERMGVVTFNYPCVAARALSALAHYAEFRRGNV